MDPIDLCAIAGSPPPNNQTVSNLTNPVSLQTTTISVSAVLLALTFGFVVGRIWINKHKLKQSDYCTIVAFVIHSASVGTVIALSKYNRHQWDIPACWFDATYLKLLYVQVLTFGLTLLFSKASIFLLYLELFGVDNTLRYAIYIGLTLNTLMCLLYFPLASYYDAPPPGKPWEYLFTHPGFHALVPWGIFTGSFNVALDIYIFILPLHTISGLNLSFSKRLQLWAVFATALVGVTASAVALVYRVKLLQNAADSTWLQGPVSIASVAEDSIALIVASAPAFASFFRLHVSGSRIWVGIQSNLRYFTRGSRGSSNSRSIRLPDLNTFGSPDAPDLRRKKNPLELRDTALLESVANEGEAVEHEPRASGQPKQFGGGIMRTVDLHQETHRKAVSTEHLV
ncbi:hypothetical protein F5Y18DRAFT_383490 [Xylariaceae sp. FL1019]|nr:hypothetical protein F5Y18DRAFT_383490 [Xylariaceae sp. FL1019]